METSSLEIKKTSRKTQKKIDFKTYEKLIYAKTIFEIFFKLYVAVHCQTVAYSLKYLKFKILQGNSSGF